MKKNITTQMLLSYDQQAKDMGGTLAGEFNSGKIRAFYNENGVKLQGVYEKRLALLKEWCVFDEKDVVKMREDNPQEPILLEGKAEEDFKKALMVFLTTPVAIEI